MTIRGRQSKSRRSRVDDRDPFDVWRSNVQAETDEERRDLLVEAGIEAGFCDRHGRVLDPNALPHQALNDEIRRAAGRTPRSDGD